MKKKLGQVVLFGDIIQVSEYFLTLFSLTLTESVYVYTYIYVYIYFNSLLYSFFIIFNVYIYNDLIISQYM